MIDVCKIKSYSDYETIKSGVINGKLLTVNRDGTISEQDITLYFSDDIELDGVKLSRAEKSALLSTIRDEILADNNLSEEQLNEVTSKIEAILTNLGNVAERLYPSKVIISVGNSLSPTALTNLKQKASTRKLLNVSEEAGKFIPIFNSTINNYVYSTILSSLKEVCLWNENEGLIIGNNKELTQSVLAYQQELLKTLCNFTGTEYRSLIGTVTEEDIDFYNQLMNDAWNQIVPIINSQSGEINLALDPVSIQQYINPIMAFYVLQNFDSVIQNILSEFITINSSQFGSINASEEKYKLKSKKKLNSSYSDDLHSSDGNNLVDHILDTFLTSTKKSNGLYLDKKFKDNLLCVIKDVLENKVFQQTAENELKYPGFNSDFNILTEIVSSDTEMKLDEQVDFLIKFLGKYNPITETLGIDACSSLSKRLQKFTEALNKRKAVSSSKTQASLDVDYNIGAKLISHLSKGVVGIIQITGDKSTNSITPGTKKKSKQYVKTRLSEALLSVLRSNHRLLTDPRPLLIGNVSETGLVDLYSKSAQDLLTKITGINFRDPEIIGRFNALDENGQIRGLLVLANFIREYRRLVQLKFKSSSDLININQAQTDELIEALSNTPAYIAFSNILVEENEFEIERMFDQLQQEQARTTIANLSTSLTKSIARFVDYMGERATGNILIKWPNLTRQSGVNYDGKYTKTSDFNQHITFAGDCKLLTGDIIRWVRQNPSEINTAYLNQLYLFNILDHNTVSFQIDVSSDKVKTPITNINLQNTTSDNNFVELSLDGLYRIKYEQLANYYSKIEEDILEFFHTVLGVEFSDLILLDNYLQKENVTIYKVLQKVKQIQKTNPDFEALPEIYYSQKGGKIFLNRSLCYEIFKSRNPKLQAENEQAVFQHYKETLRQQGVRLLLSASDIEKLNETQKYQLAHLFFDTVTSNTVEDQCKQIAQQAANNNIGDNDFFDYFLKKFIAMQNIVREADLELFNKHYWCHGKGSNNISLEDIFAGNNLKTLFDSEMKARIEKSTKRNNSQSATLSPMEQGYKYGVPRIIKVASIASLNTDVVNNFGNTEQLHAHDGAIWSSYILRLLERNSQLQISMANSAKIIALEPHNEGFIQIKCADYVINNEWIRNSITQGNSLSDQFVDGRRLYEVMLRPAKISQEILPQFEDYRSLGLDVIYYNFQGKNARLEDIETREIIHNGESKLVLHPVWVYADGSNIEVPTNIVAKSLGLEYNEEYDEMIINDLFDLWCFFGGENSLDANLEFSDLSNEYVTYLMCEFAPELKEQMIGKICDPESVKSTPFPVNSREDVYNGDPEQRLITSNLHTSNYGPQQDYSHETDEDTIPFTTQVIGAIAFNGENSELVSDLYEAIGNITAEALSEFTDLAQSSNKTKLYRKIGKLVANNLVTNGVISNASSVLEESLKQLVDDESIFAKKAVPFSNTQLYHVATSQILAKLNKIIKQRFAGTAVVQNPAQGIIGIYQDVNGVCYSKSDLIRRAKKWYKDQPFKNLYTAEEIVQAYIEANDNFVDETVGINCDFNKINISDNVTVEFTGDLDESLYPELSRIKKANEGKAYAEFEISNPFVLQELHELYLSGNIGMIQLMHSRPRNLTTTLITFTDTLGNNLNFWLLNSTKAILSETKRIESLPKSQQREAAERITEIKLWHNENRKGLGEKINPYYYATIDDFRNGIKTLIVKDSLTYRGGEEVLPRQYKRKYSINGSMADILQSGPDYFKQLAEFRLKVSPTLNLENFGMNAFAISTNDFDIIITSDENSVNENTTLDKVELNKWQIYTEDEELIPNVYLPSDNFKVEYVKRQGEKPVLVIKTNTDISHDEKAVTDILRGVNTNSIKLVNDPRAYAEILQDLDESKITEEDITEFAQQLYTSFRLTTKTVSVRIPSQSFQSFLSNETVLFTESDDNNGYMNLWEMWFQGSDYDIDKAYTIMFEVGESGVIEGNIFSDYSSPERLMESLLLRNPNNDLRIYESNTPGIPEEIKVDITEAIKAYVLRNQNDLYNFNSLNQLLDFLKLKQSGGKQLVASLDSLSNIGLNQEVLDLVLLSELQNVMLDLIQKLNAYNGTELNESYKKNKLMAGIRYASQDIHNLQSSQVPMQAAPVNGAIDESNVRNGINSSSMRYYNDDPGHIAHFQYQNSIGKEGVGISANGIKVLSAMQQNANVKIKNGTLTPMSLNLKFVLQDINKGPRFVRERVLKLPNTPMTKEQFNAFYSQLGANGQPIYTQLPVYDLYQSILAGLRQAITNNKDKRFIECYSILKDNSVESPAFLDVLYLMQEFEQNVADMMSVFISLCTDNAKELRLFMIGATPDLLNLPLAMLAVGMDIQDVTDICVQYVVPIMRELNSNRYISTETKDVKDVIQQHINAALAEQNFELKDTYESLMTIYKIAQEMKLIAQQFKVNQGVSVITTDVQAFLDNLNRQMDSNKIDKTKRSYTYKDFFENPETINEAIANYDAAAINVVEIVTSAKNFFKQLEACYRTIGIIEDTIAVANITKSLSDIIKPKKQLNKVIQQTVQNALLSRAFMSMPDITFEKRDTRHFGNWGIDLAPSAQIGVSTKMKVDNLLEFIEEAVIPYLQKTYKDNFFVQLLRRNTSTGRYELPFNSFDVKGDLRQKLDITKATIAFAQISPITSKLKTIDGTDITLGDLIYLYATIVNQNRVNSLSTIAKDAAGKGSQLNLDARISGYLAEIDRLVGISTTNPNEVPQEAFEEFNQAVSTIENLKAAIKPYAEARLGGNSSEITINGVKVTYDIDPDFPLFTMVPGRIKSQMGYAITPDNLQTGVAQALQTLLNGYNSSARIIPETVKVDEQHTLSFSIQVPGRMGQERKPIAVKFYNVGERITEDNFEQIGLEIHKSIQSLTDSLQQLLDQCTVIDEKRSIGEHLKSYPEAQEAVQRIIDLDLRNGKHTPLIQNLINWLNPENDAKGFGYDLTVIPTGTKYVKTHIDKIGEKPILVLNPIDLNSKSAVYTVLNLFLDALINGIPSAQNRLAKLLSLLTGENIEAENLTEALNRKDIQTEIRSNQVVYMWYQKYLDDSTLPQLKQTAYNNLIKFEKALGNPDLYYYTPDESLDNEIGDIFVDKNSGEKYIYLGDTDTNLMILRNLDPNGSNIVDLTYKSKTEFDTYERIQKARINSDYSTNILKPSTSDTYAEVKTKDIRQGDVVTISGIEYYVSAVLYEKLPNKGYKVVLLGSSDGQTLVELNSERISTVKRVVNNIEGTLGNENFNITLPDGKAQIKDIIARNMYYKQKFTYFGSDDIVEFKSYTNGYITTIDNRLIPVEAIKTISSFDLSKLYPKLPVDISYNTVITTNTTEAIQGAIFGRPEFRYGYNKKAFKDGSRVQIWPAYKVQIGNTQMSLIPFNINPDLVYRGVVNETTGLDKNDTVLILQISDDQTTVNVVKYVILEKVGNQYIALKSVQSSNETELIKNEVVVISNKDLQSGKLYKDEEGVANITLANSGQVYNNDYDIVNTLLDHLATKFGAKVKFIEDPEANFFARVNNGIVEINLAKKQDGLSDQDFIIELGIHEFMHLAITALKVTDPTLYFTLMEEAKKLEVVNNSVYSSQTSLNEEAIVRKLTELIMNNNQLTDLLQSSNIHQDITSGKLEQIMIQSLMDLLSVDNIQYADAENVLLKPLKTVLESSRLAKGRTISQLEMMIRTLRDEYMDKIKYECE